MNDFGVCTDRVNALFLHFAIFYGHVWRSQFKNEAFTGLARKEWINALANYDALVIDKALADCLKRYELPPTLVQFVECCKRVNSPNNGLYQPLPYKQGDPEVAKAAFSKMRKLLNCPVKSKEQPAC